MTVGPFGAAVATSEVIAFASLVATVGLGIFVGFQTKKYERHRSQQEDRLATLEERANELRLELVGVQHRLVEVQRELVGIEKERDRRRMAVELEARVTVAVVEKPTRLRVHNAGPADATEVSVALRGHEGGYSGPRLRGSIEQEVMHPGDSFEIHVDWEDHDLDRTSPYVAAAWWTDGRGSGQRTKRNVPPPPPIQVF